MHEPGEAAPRRRLTRKPAAKGCILLAALAVTSCSGDRRPPPNPLLAHPLSVARPTASAAAAQVSAPKAPLGLEAFAPLLAAPALRAASDALEAGDEARAAREVEAVMAKHPVPPEE